MGKEDMASQVQLFRPNNKIMTHVVLAFYQEDPDNETHELKDHAYQCQWFWTWFYRTRSRVTAWWVRIGEHQYGHVELMFPDGAVTSTTEKTGLHYDYDKLLSHTNYSTFISVEVTQDAVYRMQQFASERVGRPFNSNGRLWNNVRCLRNCFGVVDTEDRSYYCSEFILTMLQMADIGTALDARCINPTQLYCYLVNTGVALPYYNAKHTQVTKGNMTASSNGDQFTRLLLGME